MMKGGLIGVVHCIHLNILGLVQQILHHLAVPVARSINQGRLAADVAGIQIGALTKLGHNASARLNHLFQHVQLSTTAHFQHLLDFVTSPHGCLLFASRSDFAHQMLSGLCHQANPSNDHTGIHKGSSLVLSTQFLDGDNGSRFQFTNVVTVQGFSRPHGNHGLHLVLNFRFPALHGMFHLFLSLDDQGFVEFRLGTDPTLHALGIPHLDSASLSCLEDIQGLPRGHFADQVAIQALLFSDRH
mmetsp:Transcript_27684/g.44564  ORF Transcript_27684/g.44564 Transcript_27684/m.44564 type:complete len:243 (+) Transcript_27684:664-1392(+)